MSNGQSNLVNQGVQPGQAETNYYNNLQKRQDNIDMAGAIGTGVSAGTNLIGALRAYDLKKQNSARSIASAKQTHANNQAKFGVSHQDAYLNFLITKGKLQQNKFNLEDSFHNSNIQVNQELNKYRDQVTQTSQQLSQQLIDGYHRMSATDMSSIQGKLAASQMNVERAKILATSKKSQIASNKSSNDQEQEVQEDIAALAYRKSQQTIALQQSEETDAYNSQIADINRQMAEAKRQKKAAIVGAIGSAVGMAAGAAIGGPAGASAGGSIGGSLGSVVGGW